MKLRSKMAAVAAVAAAALVLSACSSGSAPASTPGASAIKGGTLTIATLVDLTSFDPAQAHQGHAVQFDQPVYDSLIRIEPDGKTLVPMLATKWSYNSTNTVLTLTIRKGVKFSDGTALNAAVVKTNLDRFRTGNGPDAATLAAVTNVKATNATTVVLTLSAPNPSLLNYLGNEDSFIASPKAIAGGHLATQPVGSGPYTYDAAASVAGSKYTFVASKNYWDPSLQKFKTIVLTPIANTTATLNALVSGQVDAALLTPKTAAQATGAGMTEYKFGGSWQGLFIFDRDGKTVPALGNVKVRQAINLAIDKKTIITQVNSGLGNVTSQILPPGLPGYTKSLDTTYGYNVGKAKKLMAASGFGSGFSVSMPTVTGFFDPALIAAISQNLSAIGITVNWVNVPGASFVTDLTTGKFPMTWFQESQGTAWYTSQVLLAPTAVYNPEHTTDPKVESLIKTIQMGSTSVQATAATQLNTYITDQAWFAPFFRVQNVFFTDSKVTVVPQQFEPVPYIYNYSPKG
jgi:peptide/nickel transport system substrate-binding protein